MFIPVFILDFIIICPIISSLIVSDFLFQDNHFLGLFELHLLSLFMCILLKAYIFAAFHIFTKNVMRLRK